MNSDHYFEIGSTHRVCEDYAISGVQEGQCYGIIADGCSSSKDTDIGSRLLVRALQGVVHKIHCRDSCQSALLASVYLAQAAARIVGIHNTALDATLGVLTQNGDRVILALQGDGVIAYKYNNGLTCILSIYYHENAPGYLSYHLDEERLKFYEQTCVGYKIQDHAVGMKPTCLGSPIHKSMTPYYAEFDMCDFEWVALMTDGAESFSNDPNHDSIALSEIVPFLTSFKTTKGKFVERRCLRAMKEIADSFASGNNSVGHFDDFSMVCIHR